MYSVEYYSDMFFWSFVLYVICHLLFLAVLVIAVIVLIKFLFSR